MLTSPCRSEKEGTWKSLLLLTQFEGILIGSLSLEGYFLFFGPNQLARYRKALAPKILSLSDSESAYTLKFEVTYSGRGVGKPGVKKSEHCIIYTGHSSPLPLREEIPRDGEAGMRLISIRVIPDDHVTKLDPVSRLDLGKPCTINHNIKVKPFGQVDALHLTALLSQFSLVWSVPSPSVHMPPPSGNHPRAAARVQKHHEAAKNEEESSSNEEEDDTIESEGERQTDTPKDPDMPIDFSLFDELKALQVNHMKILQLGRRFLNLQRPDNVLENVINDRGFSKIKAWLTETFEAMFDSGKIDLSETISNFVLGDPIVQSGPQTVVVVFPALLESTGLHLERQRALVAYLSDQES
ncbi:hypothetical protein KC315_g11161 [Hortaea werneckii]|nr:hypothetical protein KC315_g11161 [Hortaea werneckii]